MAEHCPGDKALVRMAKIAHVADVGTGTSPEAAGVRAMSMGFPFVAKSDHEIVETAWWSENCSAAGLRGHVHEARQVRGQRRARLDPSRGRCAMWVPPGRKSASQTKVSNRPADSPNERHGQKDPARRIPRCRALSRGRLRVFDTSSMAHFRADGTAYLVAPGFRAGRAGPGKLQEALLQGAPTRGGRAARMTDRCSMLESQAAERAGW